MEINKNFDQISQQLGMTAMNERAEGQGLWKAALKQHHVSFYDERGICVSDVDAVSPIAKDGFQVTLSSTPSPCPAHLLEVEDVLCS